MQPTWTGRRVLVVEDNPIVVMPLVAHIEGSGGRVIGPVPSLGRAFAALAEHAQIDGAVLDVELGRDKVWPLAFELRERGIPFVFATGSAEDSIDPPLQLHPRFAKPYDEAAVARSLHALIEDEQIGESRLSPAA